MSFRNWFSAVAPLVISGCMMPGMVGGGSMHGASAGGMHDAGHAAMPAAPTVVREVVADGVRLSAEFPSYAIGDALLYKVTVFDLRSATPARDAAVLFWLTPGDIAARPPAATHAHAGAHAPGTPRAGAPEGVSPERGEGGVYLFRPSASTAGTYTATVTVTRIGTRTVEPPLELSQVIQLRQREESQSGHRAAAGGIGSRTLLIAGALLMGATMLFTTVR